ncbi:hypothetical protein ACFL18_02880 [Patescibacteria group bacterium]
MKKNNRIIAKVVFLIFIYFIIHSIYLGITSQPIEGDSLYYHIPIAKSILNGQFISPDYGNNFHQYFPASAELILALFIKLNLPLNLYNVLAILLLFLSSYHLAKTTGLKKQYNLLFASCIAMLQTVIRWIHAQTVDIWLVVFYLISSTLLLKPKNSHSYYLKLGLVFGLLIGTKYSGPLFALILLAMFFKNFYRFLNFIRLVKFSLLVSIFGLFWYLRNYLATGNPFYPLDTPLFKGIAGNSIIQTPIWKAVLLHPLSMLNAFFGEYMIWSILIFLIPFLYFHKAKLKESKNIKKAKNFILLGFFNFLVFLILPSGDSYQLHVSQFRFSYPAFIPLILSIFILAMEYKQETTIAILTLANILTLGSLSYHPKLLFIYLPLVYLVFNQNKLTKQYNSLKKKIYEK